MSSGQKRYLHLCMLLPVSAAVFRASVARKRFLQAERQHACGRADRANEHKLILARENEQSALGDDQVSHRPGSAPWCQSRIAD